RCGECKRSSRYSSKEKTTSSAEKGIPSEKRTSFRSSSVYLRPSGDTFQDLAKADSVRCVSRLMCTRSACSAEITSREVASTERRGFNVLGSERKATSNCPPASPRLFCTTSSCALPLRSPRSAKRITAAKKKGLAQEKFSFILFRLPDVVVASPTTAET